MYIVSEKDTPHGLLVVITDKDIVGKKFEEGKLQLDLTNNFYKGEEKDEEEVKEATSRARHIHFTGDKSVALGIEANLIDQDKILWVSNVPHAEVMLESS